MGISIHGEVYNKDRLTLALHEWVLGNGGYRENAHRVGDLIEIIGGEFGIVTADAFITVYNEYYEEYNPSSEFFRAVRDYYFPVNSDDLDSPWVSDYVTFGGGANAGEILGSIFEDEFGYEGKFTNDE